MSVLLEVFGKKGYAQYRLPLRKNSDYCIWLTPEVFHTKEPLRVCLENVDNWWYILSSELYFPEDAWEGRRLLITDDSFNLVTAYKEIFTITVRELPSSFSPFRKYHIKEEISIGRSEKNDILVPSRSQISREHARISFSGSEWRIINKGINGLYINEEFESTSRRLCFGDLINIAGLRLVFLMDYIAVGSDIPDVKVRLKALTGPFQEEKNEEESLMYALDIQEEYREVTLILRKSMIHLLLLTALQSRCKERTCLFLYRLYRIYLWHFPWLPEAFF